MRFQLEPVDWLLNPWHPHTPWSKPAPRKFVVAKAARQGEMMRKGTSNLTGDTGPEEALIIWNALRKRDLAAPLEDRSEVVRFLAQPDYMAGSKLALVAKLYPMEFVAECVVASSRSTDHGPGGGVFRHSILPYLTTGERTLLVEAVRQNACSNHQPGDIALMLAGLLGAPPEVESYLGGLTRGIRHADREAIFGLPSAQVRERHQQLLRCFYLDEMLGLIAHTGLDYVEQIVAVWTGPSGSAVPKLVEALSNIVQDPAAALVLLPLLDKPKMAPMIKPWFDRYGPEAADVLDAHPWPTTGKKARERREMALALAASLRRPHQLGGESKASARFDFGAATKIQVPAWVDPAALPPIELRESGVQLDQQSIENLLALLAATTPLTEPAPPLASLKEKATAESLDRFAAELLEAWRLGGMKPKERWALASVAWFGGPQAIHRLSTNVHSWAGGARYETARIGYQCLLKTGSPDALWTVCEGALRGSSFAGEAAKAEADRRGVSVDELCDSAMPDFGLDSKGERAFRLGTRMLKLRIDPASTLEVRIYDQSDKLLDGLPKTRKDEDAEAYKQDVVSFRSLRLQLEQCIRREVKRFEAASRSNREFLLDHLQTCVLRHPVLSSLARCLVWGAFHTDGGKLAAFLIDEAGGWTGLDHESVPVPRETAYVRPLGPPDLDEAEQDRWLQLLSDYEIVQPFSQLIPVPREEPAAKPESKGVSVMWNGMVIPNAGAPNVQAGSASLTDILRIQAWQKAFVSTPCYSSGVMPRTLSSGAFEESLKLAGFELHPEQGRKSYRAGSTAISATLHYLQAAAFGLFWSLHLDDASGNRIPRGPGIDPQLMKRVNQDLKALGLR